MSNPLSKRKGNKLKLALALLVATQSSLSFAQSAVQSYSNDYASPNPALANSDLANSKAMSWPLLPGESVASLAALFYPDKPKLQRQFIARTLQLSGEIHPQLTAETSSNQASLVIIPNLKYLANVSGKIRRTTNAAKASPLRMSYGLKDAALFVVPEQLKIQYAELLERNALLKLQLEKLNSKLADLQQILTALHAEVKQFLTLHVKEGLPPVNSKSVSLNSVTAKPFSLKPVVIHAVNDAEKNIKDVTLLNGSKVALLESKNAALEADKAETNPTSWFNFVFLLPLLLLISVLAWLARQYIRRKSKTLYLASIDTFEPIVVAMNEEVVSKRAIDDVDFSLTQNGLVTGISVIDMGNEDSLQDKEEGELALEQAKIYVHIGRTDEAIALLKAHIKIQPIASLHHWLYLLDIYRETGQREEFMKYAALLHQDFNVMMPSWGNETLPMVLAASIEEFPHIVQQLTVLWQDPDKAEETQAYLDDLLTDNRQNIRAGFSMEVFQEIITLHDVLLVRDKLNVKIQT